MMMILSDEEMQQHHAATANQHMRDEQQQHQQQMHHLQQPDHVNQLQHQHHLNQMINQHGQMVSMNHPSMSQLQGMNVVNVGHPGVDVKYGDPSGMSQHHPDQQQVLNQLQQQQYGVVSQQQQQQQASSQAGQQYSHNMITPMMLEDSRLHVFRKLSKTLKPAVLLKSWQRICMLVAGIETTRDCGQANIATLEKEIYDRYHGNLNRDPPIIG
jgi:hypothetical protein